jgi:SAM-dependent methyltransferase
VASRLARALRDPVPIVRRRVRLLRLRGNSVECACCGGRFGDWLRAGPRGNLVCPRCGAQERHRAVWLYLERRTDLFDGGGLRVLHWAPEHALARKLRATPGLDYTSADLEPGAAMERMDITAIPRPDASFDVVLCMHVLEHVPEDRRALNEIARVLRPGGWALVLVPLDLQRAETLEDPLITDPDERERLYWQRDHVRLYGRDFPERLRDAGLDVVVDTFVRDLPAAEVARYGLFPEEDMYVCVKPG